jgi:hypothetical protein
VKRTVGRNSLDEGSAGRRDLYLTTHTTHKTDTHATDGVQTRNPSKQATADPRLNLCGQKYQTTKNYPNKISEDIMEMKTNTAVVCFEARSSLVGTTFGIHLLPYKCRRQAPFEKLVLI